MSGQLADHFKGAIDFGEEDEATDPSEVLPTYDQLLLSATVAIQRLWHLHLTKKKISGLSVDDFKEAIRFWHLHLTKVAMSGQLAD